MPLIKQNQEKVAARLVSPSRHSCQLWSRALAATGVVAAAWAGPGLEITEVMIAPHRLRHCCWCFRYVSSLVPQFPCKVGLTLSYPYFIKVKGTAEVELTTPGFEPGQSDFRACALITWLCWPSRARRILHAARAGKFQIIHLVARQDCAESPFPVSLLLDFSLSCLQSATNFPYPTRVLKETNFDSAWFGAWWYYLLYGNDFLENLKVKGFACPWTWSWKPGEQSGHMINASNVQEEESTFQVHMGSQV